MIVFDILLDEHYDYFKITSISLGNINVNNLYRN